MGWQIGYVEPILFLYFLNVFFSAPTDQQLMYHKVCLSHFNKTFCDTLNPSTKMGTKEENLIQQETAKWDIYNSIAKTLPGIVSTIILGAWSDAVGRKKILTISIFGEVVNGISTFLNAWFISAPVYYMLFGSVVSGVCGNFATILMCVFAYIADVTSLDGRTVRIIILDVLIFVSSVISLPCGGLILQHYGFLPLYGLVLIVYAMLVIYLCFLKESYHPTTVLKVKDVIFNGKIMETFHLFTQKRAHYYRTKIILLSTCFFLIFIQYIGSNNITILYVLHTPLNFEPSTIGYLLGEGSALKTVGAFLVVAIFIKKFKWHDYSILLLTCITLTAQTLSVGLSRKQWQVYASYIWGAGSGAGVSASRSQYSKMVSAQEQGKINSVIGIMQVLAQLIGGILCNAIYSATVTITPSFTFYVLSGVSFVTIILALLLKIYEARTVKYELQVNQEDQNVVVNEPQGELQPANA